MRCTLFSGTNGRLKRCTKDAGHIPPCVTEDGAVTADMETQDYADDCERLARNDDGELVEVVYGRQPS